MKTKLILAFSCLLCLCSTFSKAQELKFNEISDLKSTFYQYYLGKADKMVIYLSSGDDIKQQYSKYTSYNNIEIKGKQTIQLMEYDEANAAPKGVELSFKHSVAKVISAILVKDKVEIVYAPNQQNAFYKAIFDLNGTSTQDELMVDKENKSLLAQLPELYASQNGLWFLYKQGKDFKLVDKTKKTVWKKELGEDTYEYTVLNDGSLLYRKNDSKSDGMTVTKLSPKGQSKVLTMKKGADYSIDETNDRLYELNIDESDNASSKAKKLSLTIHTISDFSTIKEYTANMESDFIAKSEGLWLSGLRLRNVFFLEKDDDPIVVMQVFELESYTSTDHNNRPIRTTYTYKYGGALVAQMKAESPALLKYIPCRIAVSSDLAPIGGMMAAYHRNKLYFAFYNAGDYKSNKYKFETHTLDNRLNEIGSKEYDTHKDQDIYMLPTRAIPFSDDKYLIPASWRKKSGSGFLIIEK